MLHAPAPHRPTGCSDTDLDDVVAEFARLRPRLMGIAYRMLGSWTEAEDTVQETWLRWQTYDRTAVLNPTAFLVTTVTRLAINASQSARTRHESYVARWLPEPVDANDEPSLSAERREALELGILLLLQRLSPTERAAYILRQAFDYPYCRIAEILRLTEANVRQLVSRAGKHLVAERRQAASKAEQQHLLRAFVAAAQRGEVEALENLLAADERHYLHRSAAASCHRSNVDAVLPSIRILEGDAA
jgi:RNA polymerase sigma factor (sigma-70 family)